MALHLPPTVDRLIALLDQNFPERTPDGSESERELWMRAGERRLVRLLKRLQEEARENLLESTNVHE